MRYAGRDLRPIARRATHDEKAHSLTMEEDETCTHRIDTLGR